MQNETAILYIHTLCIFDNYFFVYLSFQVSLFYGYHDNISAAGFKCFQENKSHKRSAQFSVNFSILIHNKRMGRCMHPLLNEASPEGFFFSCMRQPVFAAPAQGGIRSNLPICRSFYKGFQTLSVFS
jgi:hypothetical protein